MTERLEEMLTGAERDVLVDLLVNGDNKPRNIAQNTGRGRPSVYRCLDNLEKEGYVEEKGCGGVWRLTYPQGLHAAQTISQHRS